MMTKDSEKIENLLDALSLEELVGQLFCFAYSSIGGVESLADFAARTKAGSVFVAGVGAEEIRQITEAMNRHTRVPVMIAADVENGPGHAIPGEEKLPNPMAWGACDDAPLIERAHEATAEICRQAGIHWTFSPIVDINYNFNNPITNIRAISDQPQHVAKIATAAVRGLQKKGLLAAGCKHFPGDGMDDRNQHFCTTVNSLSKKEWMETYGYVYREMFQAGVASVMVGHIALPAYDEKFNERIGYLPGSLSYKLVTELLRGTLGFTGCIVSDALSMIGASTAYPQNRVAIECIKAGVDMLLFPLPEYYDQVLAAVQAGEIPMERIRDAARHVLELKQKARLFEDACTVQQDISGAYDITALSDEIADKAVCVVRDLNKQLPLRLEPGDKIVILNIQKNKEPVTASHLCDLHTVEEELKRRGFRVVSLINANRRDFINELADTKVVLVNCKISCQDYLGGTLRVTSEHIGPFWRGAILEFPHVIFTSFGDPYKLYDYPYLDTYINVFSYTESSQRGFVRALLGEVPITGKSPVSLDGFFRAQV